MGANYGPDRIRIAPGISPRTIYRSRWHLQAGKRKQFIDSGTFVRELQALARTSSSASSTRADGRRPDVFRPTKKPIPDQRRLARGRESTQYENDRSSFASLPGRMQRADP